jgi:membrane protease YdiL (CAAX protease family)
VHSCVLFGVSTARITVYGILARKGTSESAANRKVQSARMQKYIEDIKNIKDRTLWGYDLNLIAVVTISTLVVVLEHYHGFNIAFPVSNLIYFLLIPLAAGFLLFRDKPWDYGVRIGRWRMALVWTTVTLAVFSLIVYGASKIPEVYRYYHLYSVNWLPYVLGRVGYMFAWEFLFRGYMLFGLERSIGRSAIFVQVIPFALLHFGATDLETLVTIPEGFVLGWLAYRTRSFLPCFIVHIGIDILMTVLTY